MGGQIAIRVNPGFDGSESVAVADGRSKISFVLAKPQAKNSENALTLKATLRITSDYPIALDELVFFLGQTPYTAFVEPGYSPAEKRTVHQCPFRVDIPYPDTAKMSIHNALRFGYTDAQGRKDLKRAWLDGKKGKFKGWHGPFFHDAEHGLVAYFRQNYWNKVMFTVRHENVTDSPAANRKLNLAHAVSKLLPWLSPIIMFEKNGQHYEESGKAVFERLVDEGNKDAYFVMHKSMLGKTPMERKYRKRVLVQHSFKHYLYYFCSKRFIGSEAIGHALELRCENAHVQRKARSKDRFYVFLQHGVMYMVSLDCPVRTSFQRRNLPEKTLVAISSELEAQHFVDMAGFKREELVVSGLPKFDSSFQNPGADKILVMPTWRIWEFAAMRENPSETAYVKMVNRIVEAIPQELHDKVIVAPHPLFNASTFVTGGTESIESYDVLLRDVALLITDYSSIAYDAFYRGANVLFYWEEKDECMARYGGNTHLMIDDETAFGPTCYGPEEVAALVRELYKKPQSAEHAQRYRRIVEHHDGHNTERLVRAIQDAGII